MNWWIWLWVGMIVWLTIGGAWDDYRDRRRTLSIGLGVLTGLVCVAAVLAFSSTPFAVALGRWLLPLSVFAGVQFVAEAIRDLRALTPDPELTTRENRAIKLFGVLAVGLVFGAAVIAGIVKGAQWW